MTGRICTWCGAFFETEDNDLMCGKQCMLRALLSGRALRACAARKLNPRKHGMPSTAERHHRVASPCEAVERCCRTGGKSREDDGCDGCEFPVEYWAEQAAAIMPDDGSDLEVCKRCNGTRDIPMPLRVRPNDRVGHFDDNVYGMACPDCRPILSKEED